VIDKRTYAYDASDQRVRKSAGARHSIYVFGSLELRSTELGGAGYTVDDTTEVPYLFGHGVRLARVTYTDAADFQTERRRIFLELGDHLGSTSVVLDRTTGELVERSAAYAYGGAESHYRPERWDAFREDYRFTGKEDDIEVGLIYFGARYLNPQLGRWISADPLAVHAPGEDDADLNLYAYVSGRALVDVDPVGLAVATPKNFDWSGGLDAVAEYFYKEGAQQWAAGNKATGAAYGVLGAFAQGGPTIVQTLAPFAKVGATRTPGMKSAPGTTGAPSAKTSPPPKTTTPAPKSVPTAQGRGGKTPGASAPPRSRPKPPASVQKQSAGTTNGEGATPEPAPTEAGKQGPTEAYNRAKHYGRTPTKADRKAVGVGEGEVADHDPPLVKRYYEGDPARGEKPGYRMTPQERAASASDRTRMAPQPKQESNAQGGKMRQYSAEQRKANGL